MVGRVVQDLLRTLPCETLEKDFPDIMKELISIGDGEFCFTNICTSIITIYFGIR